MRFVPITELLMLAALSLSVVPAFVSVPGSAGCEPSWPAPDPWTRVPLADGFDYAVGAPDAVGYYDAQPFGVNHHLGEDWNGVGGGHTDLGDPVYSIAHGEVTFAEDVGGGWGQVVRVVHRYGEPDGSVHTVESLYAHLDQTWVVEGDLVCRGEEIGTIGDAGGRYIPHLHLELRDEPDMEIGPGYSTDRQGYLEPRRFIEDHR